MPRRSDAKARMVMAARGLFREHGYRGTAMSDVLEASQAPRGSVYFHFPGGKEELGTEVVLAHIAEMNSMIDQASLQSTTPGELVVEFLTAVQERLVRSGYRLGCAVAPIVLEMSTASVLTEAARQGLQSSVDVLAARLIEKGVPKVEAPDVATAVWSALEGALVLGRSLHSIVPFEKLGQVLAAHADRLAELTE